MCGIYRACAAKVSGECQRRVTLCRVGDCIEERVLSKSNDVEIIPVTDQEEFFFDVTFQNHKGSLNMQLEYRELDQLVTKIEILDFIEDETR